MLINQSYIKESANTQGMEDFKIVPHTLENEIEGWKVYAKEAISKGLNKISQENIDNALRDMGINPNNGGPFNFWQYRIICGTHSWNRGRTIKDIREYNRKYGNNGPIEEYISGLQNNINECYCNNEYGYNARHGYYRNNDRSDNYDEPLYAWGDHMIMNYDPDFHRPLSKREQKKFALRKKAITPQMEKIKQAWEKRAEKMAEMPQNYNESKTNKNMKKAITESHLRSIIAESIKKYISEAGMKSGCEERLNTKGNAPTRVNHNNKYPTSDEANARGFKKAEYQDFNKPYDIWCKGKESMKVARDKNPWEKNGGKTGFTGFKPAANTAKITESELRTLIAESVKKVLLKKRMLREHEDDWFNESDTAFIGRTSAYYSDDDSSVYEPDYWTYSNEPNDRDFAGEVYELNDEGKAELNYWIRCQRFNEYQRSHAFNPRTETPEQEWALLTRNYGRRIR